jgi:hypothetical protein
MIGAHFGRSVSWNHGRPGTGRRRSDEPVRRQMPCDGAPHVPRIARVMRAHLPGER